MPGCSCFAGLVAVYFGIMIEKSTRYDRIRNLWAPWRMEYIESLHKGDEECFLCRYRDEVDNDEKNLVVWRGKKCLAVLNRFPYTGGHALVAPLKHVGELAKLDADTMLEMMEMLRDMQLVLAEAIHAEGFNIGINAGRCAGAGLPDHIHAHVVPRWGGDTNFMSVFDDVRVIPDSLHAIYQRIQQSAKKLHLPKLK